MNSLDASFSFILKHVWLTFNGHLVIAASRSGISPESCSFFTDRLICDNLSSGGHIFRLMSSFETNWVWLQSVNKLQSDGWLVKTIINVCCTSTELLELLRVDRVTWKSSFEKFCESLVRLKREGIWNRSEFYKTSSKRTCLTSGWSKSQVSLNFLKILILVVERRQASGAKL